MEKKSPLEERWDAMGVEDATFEEIPDGAAAPVSEETVAPAQVVYGVHLMMMDDGKPHVEITGKPSYPELLRLLDEVSHNMRAELTAERVVGKLKPYFGMLARGGTPKL